MKKYLAVMIAGSASNRHLEYQTFEAENVRTASKAAQVVLGEMQNKLPDQETEQDTFISLDELLTGVSLDDKTAPLYLAAITVVTGNKVKMYLKALRGKPPENFFKIELLAEEFATLQNATLTSYYCSPLLI